MKTNAMLIANAGLAFAVLVLLSGCTSQKASDIYSISGTISYDGKPLPKGNISFAPDASKNNQGPGVTAEITDGKYETPDGKGISGGPYVLTINGYDGVPIASGEGGMDRMGKMMFEAYELKADLPREDATHDIEIPKRK
ncbi:hypothetical protein ACYFX5_04955 [Bremerella sp. T1]|uniref:hypothetical protein n=1 Tax=Bremerella sp. TYQ1 TaxID=3119568 RepID=UPI001CCA393C|nr:hypothetical protein [Bremerella volcania]UBM37612.1 hypothetical protein LA756_06910 [Bremerella volcania]